MKHCSQRSCWEKTEMRVCVWRAGEKERERKWDWQEVWRRWNKPGDGHQKGRCRERERAGKMGGKQTRESAVDGFVPVVQKSFSSFGKTCFSLALFFCSLSVHPALSCLSPVSVPSSPFISLHALPLPPSICPPLNLSEPVSTRLSMASALCFPPPVVFSLSSPRMHLFKSCFTKTVLKQTETERDPDGGLYLFWGCRWRRVRADVAWIQFCSTLTTQASALAARSGLCCNCFVPLSCRRQSPGTAEEASKERTAHCKHRSVSACAVDTGRILCCCMCW